MSATVTLPLSVSTPQLLRSRTGPRRGKPASGSWLRRLQQVYGRAALLDMHR